MPFVCEIKDCDIVGPKAVALSDGKVIMETVHLAHFDFDVLKGVGESNVEVSTLLAFLRALSRRSETIESFDSEYVFPLVRQDVSYFHWIVEYLPKLRLLEHYQTKTGRHPTILIESDPRDYVLQSLKLAGYGSDRYKEWNGVCRRAKHLIVPSHRTYVLNPHLPDKSEYYPSMADLTWLRSRMRANVDADDLPNLKKRIYVSRQQTQSNRGRRVINYRELMDFLNDRGFTSYALEKLTFKEQIKLFTDGQMIMGPHGAGLMNMLFADDPVVIELFTEHRQEPYFYYIAKMFGFNYVPIVTKSEGDDLVVDIPSLRNCFDKIGI